jgi:hypothetical protein
MQAIPYGSLIAAAVNTVLNELKKTLLDKAVQLEKDALSAAGGMDESGAKGVEATVVTQLKLTVQGAFDAGLVQAVTRECAGVLVYGKTGVNVGGSASCPVAAGMFVSDGDVTVSTDYVVGSLLSAHGKVTAKKLLFYPYFTRASLPVPKEDTFDGDWLKKGADQLDYGSAMYDGDATPGAVDVGPPVERMTAGGWDQ